jgi:hypothetical protein
MCAHRTVRAGNGVHAVAYAPEPVLHVRARIWEHTQDLGHARVSDRGTYDDAHACNRA